MRTPGLIRTVVLAAVAAVSAAACTRSADDTAPPSQTTTGEQATTQPITVAGCLRAGPTENTFVLTTAKTEGAGDTATYQLAGAEGVNLGDHIGQQVQVSGTIRAAEQVRSRSVDEQADKVEGTAGSPVVVTQTELDMKRLDVTSVQSSGSRCAE